MKYIETYVGLLCVALGIAAPIAIMQVQARHTRHFAVVKPGILYRSGQMTTAGLARVTHDHNIRTVVCIREAGGSVLAEEDWCNANEVRFVRIDIGNWDGVPGAARVDSGLKTFLDVMKDPANHPVLVHCFAGTHRTGGYVAVYRMECENWSNDDAIAELRAMGYTSIATDLDINEYLNTYRPGALAGLISPSDGKP